MAPFIYTSAKLLTSFKGTMHFVTLFSLLEMTGFPGKFLFQLHFYASKALWFGRERKGLFLLLVELVAIPFLPSCTCWQTGQTVHHPGAFSWLLNNDEGEQEGLPPRPHSCPWWWWFYLELGVVAEKASFQCSMAGCGRKLPMAEGLNGMYHYHETAELEVGREGAVNGGWDLSLSSIS